MKQVHYTSLSLLVASQNYGKILHCFILSFPQLSGKKVILLSTSLLTIQNFLINSSFLSN